MNRRLFSIVLLLSAFPFLAFANVTGQTLNEGDFLSARKISRNGQTLVSVKLSKAGKSKFKKLNTEALNEEVHSKLGGVDSDFVLRVPIDGSHLEMGPYSAEDAEKVVSAINR